MHTTHTCSFRPIRGASLLLLFIAQLATPGSSSAFADEPPGRMDAGVLFRFMPTGWIRASEHSPPDIRALPALGGALFFDYSLNPFLSIGASPELTLNVIPKVQGGYPVSALIAGSLRFRAQYPRWRHVVPYVLFSPGYSVISSYKKAGPGCACSDYVDNGDSHGFMLAGYGGLRVWITPHHSIAAEMGYVHGFQTDATRTYAPAYLSVALGWQVAL
jgi:hypothetical protein